MKKILHESMGEVGKKVEEGLKDQIDEDVYDAHNPEYYQRTYELRDSVTHSDAKEIGEQIVVEVGHDYDKINTHYPNQHMSVVDGSDVSNQLPKLINDGTIGDIFGNGAWTEPRPYMDNMKDKIEREKILEKELKKSLHKRGIKTD